MANEFKTDPKSATAFFLFLFFLSFYFLTSAGGYKSGDGSFMRVIAKRMADQGEIGIADLKCRGEKDLFFNEAWIRGTDGRYYIKWGIGQSVVETPFFFVSRIVRSVIKNGKNPVAASMLEMLILFLCPASVSALGVMILFLICRRLGYKSSTCLILGLCYGLLTMAWPYSKSMMSEPTLNTAMLAAVYMMLCYRWQNKKRYLFLAGLASGFAILVKVVAVVLVAMIPVYLLAVIPRHQRIRTIGAVLIWFMGPVLVFGAIQMAFNEMRYGSLFAFGYASGRDALGFCTPLLVGLWGLFLSPGKSFFLYNPITVMGVFGFRRFFLWRRPEAIFFLGLGAFFILIHAKWWAWAGDWAWGPRFLLVLTPAFIIPLGTVVDDWADRSRLTRATVMVLVGLSLFVQVLGVFIHPFSFIQARTEVLNHLVGAGLLNWGAYSREYIENALVNFSPMFSHVVGNFWLFKHMLFSYDIWADVPWIVLGDTPHPSIPWVIGNRVVPDWWPVAGPVLYPGSGFFVWPLSIAGALLSALLGGRLLKSIKEDR